MTGEQVPAADVLAAMPVLGESDLYDEVAERLGAQTPGERAGALELLLEALYLERRISKDSAAGETVYG
jgi:magnesium chelatase subunit I